MEAVRVPSLGWLGPLRIWSMHGVAELREGFPACLRVSISSKC